MNCPKCKSTMVKSQMLSGAEFDYCRTCKKELAEMIKDTYAPAKPGKIITLPKGIGIEELNIWPNNTEDANINPDDEIDLILDDRADMKEKI